VPIGSLAKAVRLFSFRRPLITAVCRPPLLSASLLAAGMTAVALATVAMAAYVKEDTAAEPPTETRPDSRLRCRGLRPLNRALHEMTIHRIADDQTDDCAYGADDVAGLLCRRESRKRRFQMIDDSREGFSQIEFAGSGRICRNVRAFA
jgi:hypothetical protein